MIAALPNFETGVALACGMRANVPAAVVNLIVHIHHNIDHDGICRTSNPDLAVQMHIGTTALKDALRLAQQEWRVIDCEYVYQNKSTTVRSNRPPNRTSGFRGSLGEFIGRECRINWQIIRNLQETGRSESVLPSESKSESALVGRNASLGRDGNGITAVADKEIPPDALPPDEVRTLALTAMQKLFRKAQVRQEVTHAINMVHSWREDRALSKFIAQMPSAGLWTPWERTVNLFSFWVEHHPFKKLKHPISAFIAAHQDWLAALTVWESTAVHQLREFPPPPEDRPEVRDVIDSLYEAWGISCSRTTLAELLTTHTVAQIKFAAFYQLGLNCGISASDVSKRKAIRVFLAEDIVDAVVRGAAAQPSSVRKQWVSWGITPELCEEVLNVGNETAETTKP